MKQMSRTFALSLAFFGVFLGISVVAQQQQPQQQPPQVGIERRNLDTEEKPVPAPKEFVDVMKSNAAIIPDTGRGGTLNQNLTEGAENYDGLVKDLATLKGNFTKLRELLTQLQVTEALKHQQIGEEAINTMQRYATDAIWQQAGDERVMANNKREIERAKIALNEACRNCHIRHRVWVIASPISYQISK
jgi:hypothetical protein